MNKFTEERSRKTKARTTTVKCKKEIPKAETIFGRGEEISDIKKKIGFLLENSEDYIRSMRICRIEDEEYEAKFIENRIDIGIKLMGLPISKTDYVDALIRHRSYIIEGIKALFDEEEMEMRLKDLQLESLLKECPWTKHINKAKVLDVGSNVGWLVKALRKKYGTDSYGVDSDPRVVKISEYFGEKQVFSTDIETNTFPFEDSSFDIVISVNSLFQSLDMKEDEPVAAEIRRVLHPSGLLLINPYDSRECSKFSNSTHASRRMNRDLNALGFGFAFSSVTTGGPWGVWIKE